MEMKFDPMTGKPLDQPSSDPGKPSGQQPQGNAGRQSDPVTDKPPGQPPQENAERKFDPMTGKPLGQPQGNAERKFDPMTGKPLGQPQGNAERKFDPMTGKPLGQPQGNAERKFDPMTGKMLNQNAGTGRFDPMTGKPVQEKNRGGKKGIKIACGIAAGLVAIVVLLINLVPRIIFGSNYAVVRAASHTFLQNNLIENMNMADIAAGGKYTVTVDGKAKGLDVSMTAAADIPGKEMSVEGKASVMGLGADFAMKMDDKEMLLQVPQISKSTYLYSYAEKKSGFLIDLLEDEGIDVQEFDEALRNIFSTDQERDVAKIFANATKEVLKLVEFEKSDKREVRIDEKSRSCQGYTMHMGEDFVLDVCDIYEDATDEYIKTMSAMYESARLGGLDSLEDSFSDLFDEIRDAAEDADCDLTVYVYKKQIAAVLVKTDRDEMVLELHGGNTPWENMTLESENYGTVMELTGSVNDDTERMELEVDGTSLMEYSYNYKNGDLEVEIGPDYDELRFEGNMQRSGKDFTFELDRLTVDDERQDFSMSVHLKKGADIVKISKEDVVDLGNIGRGEWEDLFEELYDLGNGYDL